MRRTVVFCAALFLTSSTAAWAEPIINVGDHLFSPGETRTIALRVTSTDQVAGLNLYLQIGDGGEANGGLDTMPAITAVDIIGSGTIFENNNTGQYDDANPLMWASLTLTDFPTLPSTVSCNGIFANVTIDTTGTSPGQSYSLHLTGVAASLFGDPGLDTSFVDEFGMEIFPTITNGTISIVPEPSAIAMLCGFLALLPAIAWRRKMSAS